MEVTTAPASTAITLSEAKAHLRFADSDTSFDTIITDHIEAAQYLMLSETSIMPYAATVSFYTNSFQSVILDVWKIASIVVKYYDSDNALQTLDSANYNFYANAYPYSLEVTTEPTIYDRPDAVIIECTTTTLTSEDVKQGLKMIVADLFENRQTDVIGSVNQLSRATKHYLSLISKRIEI